MHPFDRLNWELLVCGGSVTLAGLLALTFDGGALAVIATLSGAFIVLAATGASKS